METQTSVAPASELHTRHKLQVLAPLSPSQQALLSREALEFLLALHMKFEKRRQELLLLREKRSLEIQAGRWPDFLKETAAIREGQWTVAPAAADLVDRRVEITGPAERKMMINALNSGAKVFMADLEDALSPTWENVIEGQVCLHEAVRRRLSFVSGEGKEYKLNAELATLVVRPRGWHLMENHVRIAGQAVSGALFDFAIYFFHNAKELVSRGSGPYFYLPKLESHLEAQLWNDVFCFAQDFIGLPRGTIRATVLIETVLAAFEMDEILYALKEHAAGLNAGRWDYLFSIVKKFAHADLTFPDRSQLTMTVPFMRAYTQLLVQTCHKRGAHAMGGMAAFIPSRRDPIINQTALEKVREDKEREAGDGFDGTWVAHPDLVPVARNIFDKILGGLPNQKHKQSQVAVAAQQLWPSAVAGGQITEAGLVNNLSVALQYISAWLQGLGAVAINNLMEDAATAEIARAEVWQWVQKGARLADGRVVTPGLALEKLNSEYSKISLQLPVGSAARERLQQARSLLQDLILQPEFVEFLTVPAYQSLLTPTFNA